jgi:hypothetical protein
MIGLNGKWAAAAESNLLCLKAVPFRKACFFAARQRKVMAAGDGYEK